MEVIRWSGRTVWLGVFEEFVLQVEELFAVAGKFFLPDEVAPGFLQELLDPQAAADGTVVQVRAISEQYPRHCPCNGAGRQALTLQAAHMREELLFYPCGIRFGNELAQRYRQVFIHGTLLGKNTLD